MVVNDYEDKQRTHPSIHKVIHLEKGPKTPVNSLHFSNKTLQFIKLEGNNIIIQQNQSKCGDKTSGATKTHQIETIKHIDAPRCIQITEVK